LNQNTRVDPESPANQAQHYDCADAEAAAATWQSSTSSIFNSLALWQIIDAHVTPPTNCSKSACPWARLTTVAAMAYLHANSQAIAKLPQHHKGAKAI
jgi:hypothetical protein